MPSTFIRFLSHPYHQFIFFVLAMGTVATQLATALSFLSTLVVRSPDGKISIEDIKSDISFLMLLRKLVANIKYKYIPFILIYYV